MRCSGALGVVQQTEVRPGIWEETVTEVPVLGTVRQRTEVLDGSDAVLPKYRTTTSISVPARGVGPQDNSVIRYITYGGIRWQIGTIVDEYPNIVIYIGEKYNGPTPE
jgi:hypothetical protein